MADYDIRINLVDRRINSPFHNEKRVFQRLGMIKKIAHDSGFSHSYCPLPGKKCGAFIKYHIEYHINRNPANFLEEILGLDYVKSLEIMKEEKS